MAYPPLPLGSGVIEASVKSGVDRQVYVGANELYGNEDPSVNIEVDWEVKVGEDNYTYSSSHIRHPFSGLITTDEPKSAGTANIFPYISHFTKSTSPLTQASLTRRNGKSCGATTTFTFPSTSLL